MIGQSSSPKGTLATVEFNRDVRPILADRCFACHGPDKNKRQAGLRLDTREGLFGDGESQGVITARVPDESELLRRIESTDSDEQMPPPESRKSVSPDEAKRIRQWIEEGASWQGHWSFEPIRRSEPPELSAEAGTNRDWIDRFGRHPIDRFVAAALQQQHLNPADPATPRVLVRRLHLDLLGLPPTNERVERFVADYAANPLAYEQLVDELLASPHFGERMAMWWLDLVRYADSVGYHGDQAISVSPYRDYVIEAFNQNKPFDEFTREQLAGDLLPSPTTEQLIASGYNRLGMMSAEGGVQDKEYLAKYIAERVRNLGGAWLGMTLGCCECHDHKFDPISQRQFYSFEAFFADIEEKGVYSGANDTGVWGPQIQVPTETQQRDLLALDDKIKSLQAALKMDSHELAAERSEWERRIGSWHTLVPATLQSSGGASLTCVDDGSIRVGGDRPATDVYTLEIEQVPANTTALRLEVLPDDSLPGKGPGRADNGNFVLGEFEVSVRVGPDTEPARAIRISRALASFEQPGSADGQASRSFSIDLAIDGEITNDSWGWAIAGKTGSVQRAVFVLEEPLTLAEGSRLRIQLHQNFHQNPGHTLGRFRLDATTDPDSFDATTTLPRQIELLLAVPSTERSPEQAQQVEDYFRGVAVTLEPTRRELQLVVDARKSLSDSITTTLITKATEPRVVKVLHRGNWMDETGDVVSPSIPELWGGSNQQNSRLTRLDLADWLVSERNPLTARALANRVWKVFFGAGLAAHLGDLGAQGEWPSHPELLDWLASELHQSKWNIKQLVRTIVISETYRQSSQPTPEAMASDPNNRWLSHQGQWRLEAELVRDVLLFSSGLLDDRIGGKSVKPFQPPGYWAYLNFPTREWESGVGNDLYRRGMYTHWQRQYLHPSLAAFDAPGREECVVDRPRSNTPLQALALLNDPSYVEAARALAARMIIEGGPTDSDRATFGIQTVLTRPANPDEIDVLLELLAKHRTKFIDDAAAAEKLLSVGPFKPSQSIPASELSAWTSVARTLLNLHETITRN